MAFRVNTAAPTETYGAAAEYSVAVVPGERVLPSGDTAPRSFLFPAPDRVGIPHFRRSRIGS